MLRAKFSRPTGCSRGPFLLTRVLRIVLKTRFSPVGIKRGRSACSNSSAISSQSDRETEASDIWKVEKSDVHQYHLPNVRLQESRGRRVSRPSGQVPELRRQ